MLLSSLPSGTRCSRELIDSERSSILLSAQGQIPAAIAGSITSDGSW